MIEKGNEIFPKYTSIDQLLPIMDIGLIAIGENKPLRDSWLDISLEYLANKQLHHKGSAYIDQIEKNVVYLRELSDTCIDSIVIYLFEGKPIFSLENLGDYQYSYIKPTAQTVATHHLNYVLNGCTHCAYHERHHLFLKIRELRIHADIEEYIEELEFCLIVYQFRYLAAQGLMYHFLPNRILASSAPYTPMALVYNTLEAKFDNYIQLWMGLVEFGVDVDSRGNLRFYNPSPPVNQPQWREFWGDRFSMIKEEVINSMNKSSK